MADKQSNRAQVLLELLEGARRRHGGEAIARLESFLGSAPVEPPGPSFVESPARPRFPGLTSKPWHDPTEYAACRVLEDAAEDIHRELEQTIRLKEGFQPYRQERSDFIPAQQWKAMYFTVGGNSVEANVAQSPRTAAALAAIPNVFSMAMISALLPGGNIRPHRGPSNCRITIHLGIVVPDGCSLRVADESRTWQEGRCLAFDDTFDHEARNDSKQTRFVLYLDVWHPDLTAVEVEFLEQAQRRLSPVAGAQSIQNVVADRVAAQGHAWW